MTTLELLRKQCDYDVRKNIDGPLIRRLGKILKTATCPSEWVPSLIPQLTDCALSYRLEREGRFDLVRAQIRLARANIPRWQKGVAKGAAVLEGIMRSTENESPLHQYLQNQFFWSIDSSYSHALEIPEEHDPMPCSSYDELVTRCYVDLMQLAAMLDYGLRRAKKLSAKQGPAPDRYGRMLFRAAVNAWMSAKGTLPPVSSNGPFHKFLEQVGLLLPEDVAESILPLNPETVRDWLRKQRAVYNRGR